MADQAPLVVIFVHPVIGRINPALLLASRIAATGNQVVFTYPSHLAFRLQEAKSRIPEASNLELLGFKLQGEPADPRSSIFTEDFKLIQTEFRAELESYLLRLAEPPACFISDEVSAPITKLAQELGIRTYVLVPQSAFALSTTLFAPKLAEESRIPFSYTGAELLPPVEIPSVGTLKFSEYPIIFSDVLPAWLTNICLESAAAAQHSDGFLINTFSGLEPETLAALRNEKQLNPRGIPVLEVGPLVPDEVPPVEHECIGFLNRHPPNSVVFVSFGSLRTSGGEDEVREILEGLRASGSPFIWMLRCNHEHWIPERTETGLIVRDWSPQLQILSHPSTGLFLSHCGWNSTMESLTRGVPVLGFPCFMDQHISLKVIESFGAGMKLPALQRNKIETSVKKMMESKEMRLAAQRVRNLAADVDSSQKISKEYDVVRNEYPVV